MLKTISWWDALIAIAFTLFALAFQIQRWGGYDPAIFMGSDAGVYTEIAAAEANPQLFTGDALLQRADNYNFYKVAHIYAIRALGRLIGDYGTGMVFLLGPLVLFHLLGYYILGRVLYRNRFWALVLSLTTSVYILTPVGDDVGLMLDPLPGFAFGALLPYLIAVIIRFQEDTDRWKILIACCAALIYVHPVSAPAWVAGLWLFYALSNPDGLAVKERVARAFALGIIASLVVLPFAVVYVRSHDIAPNDPVKLAAVRDAMEARVEPAFLHPVSAILTFSEWLLTHFHYTYFALLSLPLLLSDKTHRKPARTLITIVAGAALFSILVPSIEYLRTVRSGLPYQTEFIRPLKYLIPVIFILFVWGLCALHERTTQSANRNPIAKIGALLVGLLFVVYVHRRDATVVYFVYPTVHAWLHGHALPEKTTKRLMDVEAVRAVERFTPVRSKLFVTSDQALEVRYAALRPVVFAYKDGSTFAFSNYAALLKWHEVYKRIGGRFKKTGYSPAELEQTMIPLARELGADYVLAYFGDYFEKSARNAASRNRFPAANGSGIIPAAASTTGNLSVEVERRRSPVDIQIAGLSRVWSNSHYGLFKVLR